jgi:opacity protein-like surface antigen
MKKLVFILATLFTFSFAAQAQEGIKLGLKVGGNFSNVTGDDTEDAESIFGLHAGGFLDYGISEMVSIRPELLYSMKGTKFEYNDGEDVIQKFRFHYLDVPILARVKAGGLFFEFGPTLGFKLAASSSLEIDGEEAEDDDIEGMKSFEFGYAAGLGYELGSGLGIGLRYQGGLTSIFEDDDDKVKNSVFQLGLSYTLGSR